MRALIELGRILSVFCYYLCNPFSRDSLGMRIKRASEQLGVVFIKFAQNLSLRQEVLSQKSREDLQGLFENVREIDFSVMETILEQSLGCQLGEIFSEFHKKPLGSASIGQVYKARLLSGEEVAVKVRRPNIEAQLNLTLSVLKPIGTILDLIPYVRRLKIRWAVDETELWLRSEINFVQEVENLKTLRAYYTTSCTSSRFKVLVPKPHEELCNGEVLIMEWVPGKTLTMCSREELNIGLIQYFFEVSLGPIMMGEEHTFHMDPHPGNLVLVNDHTLGLLDCGLAGTLGAKDATQTSRAILAIYFGHAKSVTDAMLGMASKPPSKRQYEKALASFREYVDGAHTKKSVSGA